MNRTPVAFSQDQQQRSMADEVSDDDWSPYGSPSELSPDGSEAEEAGSDFDGEPELTDAEATRLLDSMYARHHARTTLDHIIWPDDDSDDEATDPSWYPFPNGPTQ